MRAKANTRGFSLLELLVVVGIIATIAAISVPYIMEWLRLYRLRAASQELMSEFQTARMQAVMKTTNLGVALVVVDANSYRYINFDMDASPDPLLRAQALGRLKSLPQDIVFDSATLAGTTTDAVRFSRLGGACWKGAANCAIPVIAACTGVGCVPPDTTTTVWMKGDSLAVGDTVIRLRDRRNNLTRLVQVQLTGRISEQ
jgi:prepilin-type N-terminal cleavage/methylation domain-containing protein